MNQQEYLDNYEKNLMEGLVNICIGEGYFQATMPSSPDITEKWDYVSPSYIKDALHEINDYPTVALGWAMYVGMGIAYYWDLDWNIYGKHENLYEHIRNKRGFDYLDEVVRGELLSLSDNDYNNIENFVRKCAQYVQNKIRHEQIEPSSVMAFYIFTRSIYVLYQIGAAIQLAKMGYKMQKINNQ